MLNRDIFKKPKYVIPPTIASTAYTHFTSTSYGQNFMITLMATTGAMWFNTLSTTPNSTTAFKLHEGDAIDLLVVNTLSVYGDSTTASYQAIVWEWL